MAQKTGGEDGTDGFYSVPAEKQRPTRDGILQLRAVPPIQPLERHSRTPVDEATLVYWVRQKGMASTSFTLR